MTLLVELNCEVFTSPVTTSSDVIIIQGVAYNVSEL